MQKSDRPDAVLGLDTEISRRDFIGGVLAGAGASLLVAPAPAGAQQLGADWTGYSGVGDYTRSNGNTASVVNAAHGIRDAAYEDRLKSAETVDEVYDLVVVGGGFAGLSATLEFVDTREGGKCLILENHSVFGGEAKQNEFDVGGVRLRAPQGSSDFSMPPKGVLAEYWSRLGLPAEFRFAEPINAEPGLRVPRDNFTTILHWRDDLANTGYYFDRASYGNRAGWVRDMWEDRLVRAPYSESEKRELLTLRYGKIACPERLDDDRWLDGMSYAQFLRDHLGVGDTACRYVDPLMASGDFAASSDAISAYGARRLLMPGLTQGIEKRLAGVDILSFPGGNATLLRHFVKAVMPHAIRGANTFADIAYGGIDFTKLDDASKRVRLRLDATVVNVVHEGKPETSPFVWLTYVKNGRLQRVRAKAVVVAAGGWVVKRIVRDLPQSHIDAFSQFHHGPILVANVAVRHWRYLNRLGIAAARWFSGFGFYTNLRAPMLIDGNEAPLDPDKPTVLSFYVGFPMPGVPLRQQTVAARSMLFATPYVTYERQIRAQLQEMFGAHGFDARRDIAGIILNRWGHAYICPPPGFFFGTEGRPSPLETVKRGYGRLAFGHSEHMGRQSWSNAAAEGRRAAQQALAHL